MKILLTLLGLYIGASLFALAKISDVLSVILSFSAAYFIWMSNTKDRYFYSSWVLLFLTVLTWGFADTVWLFYSAALELDPLKSDLATYLYLIPNLLLSAGCIVHFKKSMKKWNRVQLYLDMIAVTIISGLIFWFVAVIPLFSNEYEIYQLINFLVTMATDFICLSIIFIFYNSSRGPSKDIPLGIMIVGIFIYTLNDIFYIYSDIRGFYLPNNIVDMIFLSVIVLFAAASIYRKVNMPDIEISDGMEPQNVGRSYRYLVLFIIPVLLYLLLLYPFVALIHILAVLVVHRIVTMYVQMAINREQLLIREVEMNEYLEEQVLDRTKELLEANQHLSNLSQLDGLTGLYNRRYFMELLNLWTMQSTGQFSIFYLDLDRFKTVNDSYGHVMGDTVLRIIADRFKDWKPEGGIFARLGGDEFVYLSGRNHDEEELIEISKEIYKLVSKVIVIGDYAFHLGVSIGISRYPIDTCVANELLKYADLAMYTAKKHSYEERFYIYHEDVGEAVRRRHYLELKLRSVDFDNEFELHYQPQVEIISGEVIGVEALLRWKSSEGYISPGEFIPIAEETGIIIGISQWVTEKAIAQIKRWNEQYNTHLIMGINISPKYIDSSDFVLKIDRHVRNYNINPSWLDFEITESSAMSKATVMEEILMGLSNIGIGVSIDDFGTGYSSLSYIKRFDVDRLKIAKELIDFIVEDPDELMIVRAIVMMAKGMGLRTIAEGVETKEQLKLLASIGCDEIQGYYFSRPITADEVESRYLTQKSL